MDEMVRGQTVAIVESISEERCGDGEPSWDVTVRTTGGRVITIHDSRLRVRRGARVLVNERGLPGADPSMPPPWLTTIL
jgi:hypothetical protein